jgi:tRNA pseudouridine38-40 synthase
VRLRATIAYDGTDFRGWAPQPDVRTVGAVLAEALGVESVVVAGRTDAGVHAAANVVSFDADRELPAKAVNTSLPSDVAVLQLAPAADGFDARADARGRSYVYRINNGQAIDPLRRRFELFHPRRVDDEALAACAAALVGRHDFRAFTPSETQHVFFERTVTEAAWQRNGDKLEFRISADGFLRHMVRVVIGTMLMRPDPDLFSRLLEGRPRSDAGRTALPHGLTLLGVKYEDQPGTGAAPISQQNRGV